MRRGPALVMTEALHASVAHHVLPGDGLEAAAILLCARVEGRRLKLLVREWLPVPHAACERSPTRLTWPGAVIEEALARAEADDLSLVLLHSHPGGGFGFSAIDDASDDVTLPALRAARSRRRAGEAVCASAIMVPGGAVRARCRIGTAPALDVDLVLVVGDDLRAWWAQGQGASRPLAFAGGMTAELGRLSACVVGASGTGSVVAEQLARLGFGEIVLVDFDRVERRNLNRILNATADDAAAGALKVEVLARAARTHRPGVEVVTVPHPALSREAVLAMAEADVLFGCVDSDGGRFLLDLAAAGFLQPLVDVGVTIPVRRPPGGQPRICSVNGRIDYVKPGGSTLLERGVYTPASVAGEELLRADPEAHARRVAEGYTPGLAQEAPAVIALNSRVASDAVMELVARAYPYRLNPNAGFARSTFCLALGEAEARPEDGFPCGCPYPLAVGLAEPLLGLPALASRKAA